MSAVVEAIGDAVGGVVEAVGDAVEWVGDTVSNVVEAAMDDPVKAALQIGVMVATSGAGAAALGMSAPLTAMQAAGAMAGISGVSTLAEGGDIEDAMKSAATSFAVSQAVSFGMDAFGAANVPETVSGTTQFFDDGTSIQQRMSRYPQFCRKRGRQKLLGQKHSRQVCSRVGQKHSPCHRSRRWTCRGFRISRRRFCRR